MISKTSEPEVNIPVVDLTSLNAAQELLDAAVKYGFIFVKHTKDVEITTEELGDMFGVVCYVPTSCSLRSQSFLVKYNVQGNHYVSEIFKQPIHIRGNA